MITFKIKSNVNKGLNKLKDRLNNNVLPESVEDATILATLKWKSLIPKGTALSASNIYNIIKKDKNRTIGKVISPELIKPNSFYLNVFLEKGATKGKNTAMIKGRSVRYNGYFGAAEMTVDTIKDYFKVLVESKVKTTVDVFNN